jgi:hypothetical protein
MNISEMIDILSDDMPEFLDGSNILEIELFEHISYLILMSKMLTVPRFIGIVALDNFSDQFFEKMNYMFREFDENKKLKKSYDYIVEYYDYMIDYLERIEEYEMCSNFKNFIISFNKKIEDINGLED